MGAGSLGPVFRAHDPGEGRLVAVKAFRLDITPEQAAEFAVELEDLAASQPRHPGMAAAIAAGVQSTTPYLAQEYVAGEALDAVLRQFGPPPGAETLTTLRRIAEALDRAAGEAIHHGTLHPRDILIAEGGDARVIDLGVAQALGRSGLRVPVRRPYSAPERVNEEPWSGAADIYALGAIAYELTTGKKLPGPGRPEVIAQGLSESDGMALSDALARALDPDPGERYPSATDLVDALAAHLPRRRASRRRSSADVPLPLPLEPFDPPSPVPLEEFRAEAESVEMHPDEQRWDDAPIDRRASAGSDFHDAALEAPSTDSASLAAGHDEPVLVSPSFESSSLGAPSLESPSFAGAPTRFAALDDHDDSGSASADERVPATAETRDRGEGHPVAAWAPSTIAPAPPLDRRPFLPIAIALLVGVAAGFGWGYWTAFRTLSQAAATAADTSAARPAPDADAAPVNVDEPEVIGERGLPPPGGGRAAAAPADRQPNAAAARPPAPPTPAPRSSESAAAPGAGRTREEPRSRPAAPATGRLLVRSTPSGAQVKVDGRVRGRTPLVLRDLPLGAVRLSVEQAGYQIDERRISLTAASPSVTVESRLTRVPPPTPVATAGALVVESRPSGATVFVDGRQVGSTPLSVPDVTPGTRRIRLEMAGFNPWVTTTDVQAGTRTRVAASLERGSQE